MQSLWYSKLTNKEIFCGENMPVLEYALDLTAQHRIQIHLPAEQPALVTVMLNRSILGSLAPAEQIAGKDFRLPDNSFLHVRFVNNQPQVSRAGYLLPLVDASFTNAVDTSPAAQALERNKKLGGCLISWLILNLIVIGISTIFSFLFVLGVMRTGFSPLLLLSSVLLGVVGLVGVSLIFFWKKLGFYLMVAHAILSSLLTIPFGLFNASLFIPFIPIIILFVYLNRSGIWQRMS